MHADPHPATRRARLPRRLDPALLLRAAAEARCAPPRSRRRASAARAAAPAIHFGRRSFTAAWRSARRRGRAA